MNKELRLAVFIDDAKFGTLLGLLKYVFTENDNSFCGFEVIAFF
jgi:hypothetical protein